MLGGTGANSVKDSGNICMFDRCPNEDPLEADTVTFRWLVWRTIDGRNIYI